LGSTCGEATAILAVLLVESVGQLAKVDLTAKLAEPETTFWAPFAATGTDPTLRVHTVPAGDPSAQLHPFVELAA